MFRKIRWRIAVSYILLILAAMLALGIYISSFFEQTYRNELEAQLAVEARMVGEMLRPPWQPEPGLDDEAKHWAKITNARITLINPDGTVVGESDEERAHMDNHLLRPEVSAALANGQGSSVRHSRTVGYDMLYTAVRLGEAATPSGVVRAALPLTRVQESISRLQQVLFGLALLAAVLAGALAVWIAGYTSRPLEELTQAAGQMARGNLRHQPLATSVDEVGQLVMAFNAMAVQIRQQFVTLEAERGKLAAVLKHMTDGVMIVDREGRIQLINPAAAKMFNVSEAAIGQSLPVALRVHQPYELWKKSRELQDVQQNTFGIHKHLHLQAFAIPLEQSLPGHSLLLLQDITRQRQVELMRRDFISNVSHELRTPLAALKAIAETLDDGALEDPPAARRFLARMETEVDSLSLMVMELLELSRIESGRVPLELKVVRPLDMVNAAVERLALQAERAGLRLAADCQQHLPDVLADAGRVQQVLTNLLHNAIKFTPSGGEVICGAFLQAEMVTFFVRDSGIGMSPEDLSRVFERFYKADRARSGGGTGLGLAIARHIVEQHGGRIWAESEPEKGSVFYFTLGASPH